MKKKYGWIIQDWENGFIDRHKNDYTDQLGDAGVFSTRAEARKNIKKCGNIDETVRKVELFKNGKAKKIIPGR